MAFSEVADALDVDQNIFENDFRDVLHRMAVARANDGRLSIIEDPKLMTKKNANTAMILLNPPYTMNISAAAVLSAKAMVGVPPRFTISACRMTNLSRDIANNIREAIMWHAFMKLITEITVSAAIRRVP